MVESEGSRLRNKTMENKDEIELKELINNSDDQINVKVEKVDDTKNIILLIVLYLLQGIPGGLAFGSLPFLLKEKLSYSQLALFSLVVYPYSLKLLWSPIIDSLYLKSFGRRKTWIVPIQFTSAFLLFWLGSHVQSFLEGEHLDIRPLTIIFTVLVFLSATQDIAVDGWALELLSKENLSYASTCQTIGLNTGYFLSFTIFLALNSAEFCNKYLRSIPQPVGLLSIGSYLTFWAWMYFIVTVCLFFVKEKEAKASDEMSITETYHKMIEICKLPHIQKLVGILLTSKIGYICNDAVTSLKLLEMGFKKEDLALIVLIDFPIQMVVGYYAAKYSNGPRPLKPWLYSSFARLFLSFFSMFIVLYFPKNGITSSYIFQVVLLGVITSFTSTVQFVGLSAFFNQIADPYIGGTYMTFLNTLSNLGGTWPKYFILEAVEYYSQAECSVKDIGGQIFSCVKEEAKKQCSDLGGQCSTIKDGYYLVNTVTCFIALFVWCFFIIYQIHKLEVIPPTSWKIRKEE